MNPLLLDYFEQIVSRAEDVGKLNAVILQLAVQGKLVAQDPADEPASELLKRIAAEKKRLKIKSQPLPEIGEEERPFALPDGWMWVRLGEITNYGTSDKAGPQDISSDTWVLDLADIEKTSSKLLEKVRYKDRPFKSSKNVFGVGDVLYGKLRPYLDKVIVADESGVCTTEILPLRGYIDIYPAYLRWTLKSPEFIKYVNGKTFGVKMPRLGTKDGRMTLIPLPPLAEQKRIVERVDTLLAQTRQLETQLTEAEQSLSSLHHAATQELLAATDADEFATTWQFITDNFDTLYDEAYPEAALANVAALKQAILQLAVQGKLTRQDPADEPASTLLTRITAEKKRLGIKSKKLAEIGEEERPFALPDGWEWVRLGTLAENVHYGYTASADFSLQDYRLLRITDIQENRVNWPTVPGCEIEEKNVHKYLLKNNDILIARTGGTIGKSYIVENISVNAVFASYLIRVIPSGLLNAQFTKLFLESPLYWEQLIEESKGTGQPNVNATSLSQLRLPLPPLAEQKRIVTRVNTLLRLCDELSAHIQKAQATRTTLRDAVLGEVY